MTGPVVTTEEWKREKDSFSFSVSPERKRKSRFNLKQIISVKINHIPHVLISNFLFCSRFPFLLVQTSDKLFQADGKFGFLLMALDPWGNG